MKEQNISVNFSKNKIVFFATKNVHKFNETRQLLSEYKITTAMLRVLSIEVQDDNIEKIAKRRVINVFEITDLPVIIEDAGLFIKPLNGFPGPYSSYVYRTLGTKGILKLMKQNKDRDAFFHSILAFCDYKKDPKFFHGKVKGQITKKERGTLGFGFDPIFKPFHDDQKKTFAEMNIKEKNLFSHRGIAVRKFVKWFRSN